MRVGNQYGSGFEVGEGSFLEVGSWELGVDPTTDAEWFADPIRGCRPAGLSKVLGCPLVRPVWLDRLAEPQLWVFSMLRGR